VSLALRSLSSLPIAFWGFGGAFLAPSVVPTASTSDRDLRVYKVVGLTVNGRTSWAWGTPPAFVGDPVSVDCPSDLDCFLGGAGSQIAASTDGGTSWTAQSLPSSVGGINAISCVSTSTARLAAAVLVGPGVVFATSNGGTSWTQSTLPRAVNQYVFRMSCASSSACWGIAASDSGWIIISNAVTS
jgi:hypothetical protein